MTCCSTAAACSIVAGESSDVVEIQLHGVWLAGVRGADVAYWPCKKCKTKVDQETGLCKKHSTHGCATEQEDNRTILATVHLADWTGQLDNLLVNEAALCELTGFKTAELLLCRKWIGMEPWRCASGVAAMSVSRRAPSTSSGRAALLPSLRLRRNCHSVLRRRRQQKCGRLNKNVSLRWCMQSLR